VSCVVLWYFYEEKDMNEVVYTLFDTFDITSGTLSLLTIGGLFHVVFDLSIWYIQACPFCRPGGTLSEYLSDKVQQTWVWIGTHIAAEAAIISCTLALSVVILRASVEEDGDNTGILWIGKLSIRLEFFLCDCLLHYLFSSPWVPLCCFQVYWDVVDCQD